MSPRCGARSLRKAAVTGRFATQARDLPPARISRSMSSSPSSASIPASSSSAAADGGTSKMPDKRARSAPERTISAEAAAEQQRQRVHDDGLAAAGLAGQHVQAGVEAQADPLDHGVVLDGQFDQHRSKLYGKVCHNGSAPYKQKCLDLFQEGPNPHVLAYDRCFGGLGPESSQSFSKPASGIRSRTRNRSR